MPERILVRNTRFPLVLAVTLCIGALPFARAGESTNTNAPVCGQNQIHCAEPQTSSYPSASNQSTSNQSTSNQSTSYPSTSYQSAAPAAPPVGASTSTPSAQPPPAAGLSQPNVSITPRKRTTVPDPSESIADRRADIRIDTTLVLIPVAVTDPMARFVTGLDKENFKLYEDKVEQEVTQFSSEDAPLSVGIVFDTSGSMGAKLQRSRQAVAQFMKTANPQDEFFLVEFNDRPQLVVGFTTETEELQNRLTFTQAKGRTALLDGVYLAMNEMKKAHNPRKAILIISDGGDNSSRYTETEVRNAVREADVQIYAIGIFEPIMGRGRTQEEYNGPSLLAELSEQTGGRHFTVDNLAELPDVAAKIGIELRNQYVLGYTPKNAVRDGKYRRVQVKLVKTTGLPQLRAMFRTGYYAPTQ